MKSNSIIGRYNLINTAYLNSKVIYNTLFVLMVFLLSCSKPSGDHAIAENESSAQKLLLTSEGARAIQTKAKTSALLTEAIEGLRSQVNNALLHELEVPVPKDPGGGYTHEKHKANYLEALQTGTVFLLDADPRALQRCKDLLLQYAAMYADLPVHPNSKKQAPGKLFWQVLNEEVALVHFIQAYDAICTELTEAEQQEIIEGLIRPMVSFIKDDQRETFDKIHNHAMWAVAGVAMSGFVLNDMELVDLALYGSDKSGNSGFFKQIESLFSPDGYYSEGPYYQRYALMPLVLLAQALEKNSPEKGIFDFREGVVIKAISTTVQMSACDGHFFPLNDAIRSKTIQTPELGYALPLWYAYGGKDASLVSLMKENGNLMLTDALVDLETDSDKEFVRETVVLSDGPKGKMGGIAVLREPVACSGLTAVFKYGTHGMGHGHFDQLQLLVYDEDRELLSDYGAARFLNIPQKEGGRYLKENKSWAQQTIAHNTLVVDEQSQYSADVKTADASSPRQVYTLRNEEIQAVSAIDTAAYNGVTIQRIIGLVRKEGIPSFIIDVNRVESENLHQYDFPFHYQGQRLAMNPSAGVFTDALKPLGLENGYQYLWLNGSTDPVQSSTFSFLNGHRFYTVSSCSDKAYELMQCTLGANDPDQNLRIESSFIYRSKADNQIWINVLEPHGNYNTIHEKTQGAYSQIEELSISSHQEEMLAFEMALKDGSTLFFSVNMQKEVSENDQDNLITIKFK